MVNAIDTPAVETYYNHLRLLSTFQNQTDFGLFVDWFTNLRTNFAIFHLLK